MKEAFSDGSFLSINELLLSSFNHLQAEKTDSLESF
jgi:hypothetical protein